MSSNTAMAAPSWPADCAELASQRYAGEDGWHLANPGELHKFVGSTDIKRAKFWSTAVHKAARRARKNTIARPRGRCA